MGDLPFVVGVDSADVWANGRLFRMDQHVGTPPDESSKTGQDWGLPVYDWDAFKDDDFAWIKARATRAGQLYSIYRVDHALGFYRTYFRSTDGKQSGFTPPDERSQIALGERIMRFMSRWGEVVAEDLRRGAAVPATVAGQDRRPRISGAALGAGGGPLPRSLQLAGALGGHQRHA